MMPTELSTELRSPVRKALRLRGQAMVEYSVVLFALAMSGGVGIIVVLPMMMNALDSYLQGIYFMLNLAIP